MMQSFCLFSLTFSLGDICLSPNIRYSKRLSRKKRSFLVRGMFYRDVRATYMNGVRGRA